MERRQKAVSKITHGTRESHEIKKFLFLVDFACFAGKFLSSEAVAKERYGNEHQQADYDEPNRLAG